MNTNTFTRSAKFACAIMLLGATFTAQAAPADIASEPLITSPTTSVQPNVFLMMDDSGSMGWDYMPDDASDFRTGEYGAASSQCNGVYYDPSITYTPPVDSTGASYPDSTFTNAWDDGYNAVAGGTTNLSTSFQPFATYIQYSSRSFSGSVEPAYYYTYSGTQTTERLKNYSNTSSTFYRECNSSIGSAPGSGVFTKVVVSNTSGPGGTDERTNFANWWSYYRTRMLMMKTATGLAFKTICPLAAPTCNYRVGYATINNNNSDLLELSEFDSTQKGLWYGKLYGSTPSSSTPLREALADIGRMYAYKLPASATSSGMSSSMNDPIQYACQQNFAILTTDGYWRSGTPTQLDGTSIGNQDYFESRSPQARYDGSSYSRTERIDYSYTEQIETVTTGVDSTETWGRTDVTIGGACSVPPNIPANTTSANMLDATTNSKKINVALFSSATDPRSGSDPRQCYDLSGSGTTRAWLCRGNRGWTAGSLTGGLSSTTDSNGTTWYLVTNGASNAGCVSDRAAFNSTNYSQNMGTCPGTPGISGNYVITTPWTKQDVLSGVTVTSVDDVTTSWYTTQSTINGVTGPVSAPSTPVITSVNVSSTSTGGTSVLGTWTAGTPTSNVCTDAGSLPTPSSTPDSPPSTTVSTAGTGSTSTVLSTSPTTSTTTVTQSNSGGTSNTLADVAEYYYITDLRTSALGNNLSAAPNTGSGTWNGTDISGNVVPPSGEDVATHQHMTTFTLGLGARGKMVYDSSYESATSGDYYSIVQGSTANGSTVCPWQSSGACNWPTPGDNKPENIDDLWHAAVNGRGVYYSAANPTSLSSGLSGALAGVSARTGSSAAATTSTPFITSTDNFQFKSTFRSQDWTGELTRQQINVSTGALNPTIDWSIQAQLDANSSRNIYFFNSAATNKLLSFTLPNLTTAGLDGYFNAASIASLTQISCVYASNCLSSWTSGTSYVAGNIYRNTVAGTTTWYQVNTAYTSGLTFGATDTANTTVVSGPAGVNLVSFIRGDRTYEGSDTDNINGKFYRQRVHVMGDIVNSETVYVQGALTPDFADPGYGSHITAMADRQAMVYVGANDGMLHAFYAESDMMSSTTGHIVATGGVSVSGGEEAWTFIPTAVIPNLYKLADKKYKDTNYHQYFVDGSPVVADICTSSCTIAGSAVWKTILVGGLNGGGKSYYALDITNPAQPKALWEFTDPNMGLTYGNPKIVKMKTGDWVVLFTSGYNNTSGDGQGYLYVVSAYTGAPYTSINGTGIIGTGVGNTTTPSNLGRLDAWLTTPGVDATAEVVYTGDMLGNLWRFDINGDVGASGYDAQLLVTLIGPAGATNTSPSNIQPITAKPVLSLLNGNRMIYVGTGRYLGASDQSDTSQQSLYAIADTTSTLTTPSVAVYANPRSGGFVQQTLTKTTCPVGSPANVCTSGETVVVASNNPVTISGSNHGWFVDFPLSSSSLSTGERVNVDPDIRYGTLFVNTNEPNSSSCSVGGDSYQYQFDFSSGSAVGASTTGVVATKIGNELANRPNVVTLPDGTQSCTQGSAGGDATCVKAWGSGGGGGGNLNGVPTRKSWRVLIRN